QLSFMRPALRRLIARYPDAASGLSVHDEMLLRNVRDRGPRAVRIIVETMKEDFSSGDAVGDGWLFYRLRQLGRGAHPAVVLSGELTIRDAQVRLTDAGNNVLSGKANVVDLNGVDEWIGGVHLDSANGQTWFRQDDRLVRG